jgi:hypothetical protein
MTAGGRRAVAFIARRRDIMRTKSLQVCALLATMLIGKLAK